MTDGTAGRVASDERLILLLVGAVGTGKGTQAKALSRELGLPHLASGNLFRAAMAAGTPLGEEAQKYMQRGELVPDEITIGMFMDELAKPHAARGAILDGFPRTVGQATALDETLARRGRGSRSRHLHRGAHRRAHPTRRRPLGLPDLRHPVPRDRRPAARAGHLRQGGHAAAPARRRPARGRAARASTARCRRCSR